MPHDLRCRLPIPLLGAARDKCASSAEHRESLRQAEFRAASIGLCDACAPDLVVQRS